MKLNNLSLERFLRRAARRVMAFRDGHADAYQYRKEFESLASAPVDVIQRHSNKKLTQILQHAYRTSLYYREIWGKTGYNPNDKIGETALASLPILKKTHIQKFKDDLISNRFKKDRLEVSYTGGSSGNPTSFYRNRNCTSQRIGRQLAILERCGYHIGDRCGLIWGVHSETPAIGDNLTLRQRFRRFANGREALCCKVMHPDGMRNYHRRLKRYQPKVLYGYPNAMTHFAEFIELERLETIRVARILCTAERLSPGQRKRLTEIFKGEVFDLYCTREHGCIGFECKEHNGYHLDVGSVHLEVVKNSRSAKTGKVGKILVTDLLNYGMPFIRYEIGDMGTLSDKPCNCGCNLPVLKDLRGRVSDLLIRSDGSKVAGLMLIDLFMDNTNIENMQIIQENQYCLKVFLEVGSIFKYEDEKMIEKELKAYMGEGMKVSIKIVDKIPRNMNSGKFQEVICKVPRVAGQI